MRARGSEEQDMKHSTLIAAQVIQSVLNREGTLTSADEVDAIRDIASFTVTDPSGHKFTVAVSPASN
jgi:hypothetical protein